MRLVHLWRNVDFVAWTEQQAEALRSAIQDKANHPLDWENLAEEIESLGKSDRRELRSQIYRVVRHLAKLQFSPAADPRDGWRDSVTDGRKRAELILADSPSLKSQLDHFVSEEGPAAVERALTDLDEFGELNRCACCGSGWSEFAGLLDIGTLSDLSNIGTLFAFVLVSIGVIILRVREPERQRSFRAPGGLATPILSIAFCGLLMAGLPIMTWLRFFAWLVIGLVIYFFYSRKRSGFAS